MNRTDELRTARIESLVTPAELALRYPVTPGVATHVTDSRRRIEKILNGEDKRLLVIIGPARSTISPLQWSTPPVCSRCATSTSHGWKS
ncbi:hypothetical protein O5340_16420 [Escherichia coli]|nr:hypothetical protein [Escherichia coli]